MSYEVMNEYCCIQMSFVGVDQPPPPPPPPFFFKTFLFLQIKDVPTIHRSIGQTKVLNNSFNQFVYNFYPLVKWKPDTMPLNSSWSIL